MNYYAPDNLPKLLEFLHTQVAPVAMVLAGGTDLLPRRNCRRELHGWVDRPEGSLLGKEEQIVYIGNTGLDYIIEDENQIRIGACVTIATLTESQTVVTHLPALKQAALKMACPAIRNTATIGGNIANASPAGDSIQALLVADASVVLANVNGDRQVALCNFFTGPGTTVAKKDELIKEIVVPVKRGHASFQKLGQRKADTLSMVNSAAWVLVENGKIQDARVSIGSVAPTPLRLHRVEESLIGRPATEDTIQAAAQLVAEQISPISDQRATAAYRKKLARVLVARALRCACNLSE